MSDISKIGAKNLVPQGLPFGQIGQQANQARVAETGAAGGATGAAAPEATSAPAPPSDQVQLSPPDTDSDDARGAAVSNNIVAAWQPALSGVGSDQKVNEAGGVQAGGFNITQGPPAGMSGGGTFGPGGIGGQEPGMQAGAVYSTRGAQAA